MVKPVKIPQEITQAITQLGQQYQELQDKRQNTERYLSVLDQEWQAALSDHSPDGKRKLAMLADRISSARSHLHAINDDLKQVKAEHARQSQAAEMASHPVKALTVPCPECGTKVTPHRTRSSGNGSRSGDYDCPVCDDTLFTATWSGGIEPEIKVLPA